MKDTACLPFNDVECSRTFIRENADRLAGVILEPVAGNMGVVPATHEFIHMLREETLAAGALLIFDEVMTGFRVGLGGAQEYFEVTPDLTTYAKVIGGGFPVAAFGGRGDVMDALAPVGQVYQAGTLSGNPVAMEAGYQTLKLIEQPGFYEDLERKVKVITDPVEKFIRENELNACLQRVGTMFTLFFGMRKVQSFEDAKQLDTDKFAEYFEFMYERGIYVSPSQFEACFLSAAHTEEHLEFTRDAILEFLSKHV